MPKLKAKVALVTGATSGIGLAAAKILAQEGAHISITGRREQELASAVKEIGKNATGVRGDVAAVGDLDRLLLKIRDEKGKLDVLFANGGIAKYAGLGNITDELNVGSTLVQASRGCFLSHGYVPGTDGTGRWSKGRVRKVVRNCVHRRPLEAPSYWSHAD